MRCIYCNMDFRKSKFDCLQIIKWAEFTSRNVIEIYWIYTGWSRMGVQVHRSYSPSDRDFEHPRSKHGRFHHFLVIEWYMSDMQWSSYECIINPYEDGRWGSPLTPCHDHGTTFSSEYMGVQSWDAWGFRMTQLISSMPAPLWRNESPMIVLAAAECHSPCSTTSSHLHVLYCSLWWWFMATTSIMYWDRFAISLHVLDVLDVRLNVVGSIPVFL